MLFANITVLSTLLEFLMLWIFLLVLFFWVVAWCNRLDVYIYDYLMKRKLHASAKAFQAEGKVSTDPVGKNVY